MDIELFGWFLGAIETYNQILIYFILHIYLKIFLGKFREKGSPHVC